jgi:hypothetical protein
MVRKMKCPFCQNVVNVSSHWETAICNKCHQSFEIGVDIFELTDEEQMKEMEAARKKIKEQEALRDERIKETRKRLRAAFRLPEEDPHADVNFEDDEVSDEEESEKEPMNHKKLLILCGLACAVLLFIIIFVIFITTAFRSKTGDTSTQSSVSQSVQEQTKPVVSDNKVTTEQHDGSWVDGFSVDSNNKDGKYMIDLQSSDKEQREVTLTPDVAGETAQTDAKSKPAQDDSVQTEGKQAVENAEVEGQKDFSKTSGEAFGDMMHTAENIESNIPAGNGNASASEDVKSELLTGEWK